MFWRLHGNFTSTITTIRIIIIKNNNKPRRISLQIPTAKKQDHQMFLENNNNNNNNGFVGTVSLANAANVRSLAARMLTTLKRRATVCKTFIISSTEDEVQFFAVDTGRAIPEFKWKIPLVNKKSKLRRKIKVEKKNFIENNNNMSDWGSVSVLRMTGNNYNNGGENHNNN